MTKSSMWGGRFQTAQDDILTQINASIDVDKRFYLEDITGSKAHAAMLHSTGILNDQDFSQINTGLDTIQSEIEAGTFTFSAKLEDIHMNIESRLKDLIGDAAGRLHTGRSRNDQVATDFRLWLRSATESLINEIITVQKALLQQAHDHTDTAMPGFTHLQVAQPVTFGHHLMAYVEMLQRDKTRFQDSLKRLNQSPLGAAALAGTSYKIDRHQTAAALGFDGPMNNSLDAVSARDFAQEFLAATSICACHLSRLAEEMVTWMTPAFGFISLSDAWTTGSSIMPQKRNPDAAELVRGKSGRIFGNLQSLLVTVKGLPLAYSKDLQEDKEPVFDSFDALYLCLKSTAGMVTDMIVHKQNMAKMANAGFSTATDLADFLVQTYNLPFRDAHHVTGSIVKLAEEKNCLLEDLPLSGMQTIFPKLDDTIFSVLKVDEALKRRHSFGGTAPKNVQQAIIQAKQDYDL